MSKVKMPVHGLVPVAILSDPEITLADLKVYIVLASFQGANDDSYPSRDAIVKRCSLAVETISRSVKHLMELGWIQRDQRGLGRTNIYRVMIESELPEVTPRSLQEMTSGVTLEVTPRSLPSTRTNSEKNTRKGMFEQDSQALILATLLLTEHRKNDTNFLTAPGQEKTALQRWAADIDKILRLDHRTPEEVRAVIVWCQTPGCFWVPNILSGAKLREKFPTLLLQTQGKKPGPKISGMTFDPSRPAFEEVRM